jgi:integrase
MGNVRVALVSLLGWLAGKGLALDGLSMSLPSVTGRVTRIKRLYTKDEIAHVLAAIDRSSADGKRDYAMILLGAAFAPRALDIVSLRIEDIDWTCSKMTFILHKNKRLHTVALLPVVGNAILDYLLNGRPDCDTTHLFLTSRPPYRGFASSTSCASILRKHIEGAGIEPGGRGCGFHVFRAYAASSLLAQGFRLSVISEYLGHSNPDSIMAYLSVDEKNMRSCCLSLDGITARGV